MRVAFAGTPEFAQRALAAIGDAGHEIVLVLTQPDRPAGRGLKLQPSAVKQLAMQRAWPVTQPRSLRLDGKAPEDAAAARSALQAARADVLVVAAYGLILPQWTLELPPLGCLNIHASLLPRWRGAAPIQRSIEAGDAKTGITLMRMESGLDTGPMLRAREVTIGVGDTTATLHDRLAALGAQMIVQALPDWAAGRIVATPQPEVGITYAAKIEKAEALIDWAQAADRLEHRVRAFDPFPGMHFQIGRETVKLWRAAVVDATGRPGEVLAADGGGLIVACANGALSLLELQRSGGRRTSAAEFLRGHAVRPGSVLGTAAV